MKQSNALLKSSIIALCALTLGSVGAFAADPAKPREERGTITEVDLSQHRLAVTDRKDNLIHRFRWTEQTQFIEHGKTVAAATMKVGETARLTYTPGGDAPIVQKVLLAPAKTEGHSTAHQHSAHKS